MPPKEAIEASSREPVILFLAKFFSKRGYLEQFLAGRVHAQRLGWFQQLEEDDSGRGDEHEGTTSWLQPTGVSVNVNIEGGPSTNLTPGLAGPVVIKDLWLRDIHVFCSYAETMEPDTWERARASGDVEVVRQGLQIPERCLALGDSVALILDPREFVRRMHSAAQERGYRLVRALVSYYSPEDFHGSFKGYEAAFRKQDHFSWQREYRFAIDTGTSGDEPLDLELGDLRDIVRPCDSSDANSELKTVEIA